MQKLYFIDNHTHGAFGINFNYADYDQMRLILSKLYKKNIRGICPTLVGESAKNIQKQLALFKKIKLENNENETLILGAHLEGTFLSPKKAGIQDKCFFKKASIKNFEEVTGDYSDIVKIVTIAPEEDVDLIDYLNEKKIKTQAGHTIGNSIKNCRATTHHFNAMNPIHHRNSTIALRALLDDNIFCEVIADLIHLSEDILKLLLKTKSKEKILLISDSLPVSNFDSDIIFCNKKINSSGKDENGTLAGSIKTLDEICNDLIEKKILSKEDIRQMAFLNQISYLNLKNSEIDILNR